MEENLYEKLGKLTYRIGEKLEKMKKLEAEIKSLQVESNNVATEIEEHEQ
jgi:DNA repair exonuclease SbcCD ATPase subunit